MVGQVVSSSIIEKVLSVIVVGLAELRDVSREAVFSGTAVVNVVIISARVVVVKCVLAIVTCGCFVVGVVSPGAADGVSVVGLTVLFGCPVVSGGSGAVVISGTIFVVVNSAFVVGISVIVSISQLLQLCLHEDSMYSGLLSHSPIAAQ